VAAYLYSAYHQAGGPSYSADPSPPHDAAPTIWVHPDMRPARWPPRCRQWAYGEA